METIQLTNDMIEDIYKMIDKIQMDKDASDEDIMRSEKLRKCIEQQLV